MRCWFHFRLFFMRSDANEGIVGDMRRFEGLCRVRRGYAPFWRIMRDLPEYSAV